MAVHGVGMDMSVKGSSRRVARVQRWRVQPECPCTAPGVYVWERVYGAGVYARTARERPSGGERTVSATRLVSLSLDPIELLPERSLRLGEADCIGLARRRFSLLICRIGRI